MVKKGRSVAWVGTTVLVLAIMIFALAHCAESLPRSEQVTRSTWPTFAAAKAAYDEVKPGETSVEALKKMGYDPYSDTNVRVMSYLDINRLFVAGDSKTTATIPNAVRGCLDAQAACLGYGVSLERINRKRVGSTFLDLLNFRRKTQETGWSFRAVFVIHKDHVVYKLWSGVPKIDRQTDKENPLGPIQEPVDVIKKAIP